MPIGQRHFRRHPLCTEWADMTFIRAVRLCLFVPLLACATDALSQAYPNKSIRVILPVGPGGGMDYVGRSIVQRMTDGLGQAVVIDNRPGAGGDIGIETAVRATPDGYTLVMSGASFVVRAELYKVPYDPIRDLAAISQVAAAPYVLATTAGLPAKSIGELITYANANPGKLNYATPGNGSLSHLATEMFKNATGINIVHIPYKGMGNALTDLLAGQIQLTFGSIPAALPHIRTQRLRGLAVTSAQRSKVIPALPTVIEAGIKDFEVTQWQGLLAPARTPHAVIQRLYREINRVLQQPEAAVQLANDGSDAVGSSPAEFAAFIRSEHEKWRAAIRLAGVRAD